MSCSYCNAEHNDFIVLNNETRFISNIEISLNKQGMLRVRCDEGDGWQWITQDIIGVNFCPMCGKKIG